MRKKPELWSGSERIQWGCVLMNLLGEDSLQYLHIILTGLRSIDRSRQAAPFAQAVQTARVILGDLRTKNAVQNAVYDFQSGNGQRSFVIDPHTLNFVTAYAPGLDPTVNIAEQLLHQGLPRKAVTLRVADTSKDLVAVLHRDIHVPIRFHNQHFSPFTQHDRTRRPQQSITVRFTELVALATLLDNEDVIMGRPSLSWSTRIDNIELHATTSTGLSRADVLDLGELKHLIGLPGSGKTTLITLLCVLLKRRGQRVAVFFTSIGIAHDYLEVLRRYDVNVGILMGRSGQTHLRHANNMAELIAGQGAGGFGYTRDGADLFATSCPLPAFAESWPEDWHLGDAPCDSLREAGSEVDKLCPAWELCGRVKNQRTLVTADVWLGHVLSADTMVPAHTSLESLRYFELIAETFDLVIFDECDETQRVLDAYGTLTLELTGNDESLHVAIQKMTSLLAANRARISDGTLHYILQANEFERHMLRFLAEIRRLFQFKGTQKLAHAYADKLLTANFIIREVLRSIGTYNQFDNNKLSALSDFWERAMYRAFFFRGADGDVWPKAKKYATDLNYSVDDANKSWQKVNRSLKRYLALDHAAEADEVIDTIATELVQLFHAPSIESIRDHIRLLIVVGFTVASYQRLAKSALPLAQRGEISEELVFAKASSEMREQIPRSILGTYSAVRYRRSPEGEGYQVDYLVTDATPRLLLHRLHEIGRANVLLTSATSWLKPSTAYHVDKKPDYVLVPKNDEVGSVRMYLLSKPHPATKKPLRFSGGGTEREDNLRHMVTALTQQDSDELSEIEKAVQSVTTESGRQRKAALIVNSYEQVRLVVEQLNDVNPSLGKRTRGVLNQMPSGTTRVRYILKGQVEELGADDEVDVIVFPIASLGRGINIVFSNDDADNGKAAVGSIYFLTRPHPAAGDLGLMTSLLARATQELDSADFQHLSLKEVQQFYKIKRFQIYRRVANLLARPMSASQLDTETLVNFAANLLVPILQTIGRGMRKQMPVYVYFVDAAWAPNSAEQRQESNRSSMLVLMRQVLEHCLADPDPALRNIAQVLYGGFHEAFSDIVGLLPPETANLTPSKLFNPSPLTSETDFDDYDPDDHSSITTEDEHNEEESF